ncbi:hypothetical protein PV416_25270 [Streptomyces ipomoeae]|uniref:HEAT repeat protein n=1 Tax=Streptomyces ipomoeae 91-03 TaxID=698759 RepID=L1KNP7_9ACTN|nr:hypothetical protein [Streptomyces ipomoeae]EKX62416.1 hypothetical protein STRIP9103_02433 [Streptomyces ipomoeae 91-03]MDX2696722.1 hypothetical protein [Streptomyces ipomoeae]MDX2824312.1 hypothetical protein [Streptomyces ipomoeae]MDX2844015.1 hypothetical protein [Streptomyces ipomoeae]MDX2878270.1 hypothetical protein [Streptomyces ipomoeae]
MRENFWAGGEAARRLARGVALRDAVDIASPAAWLDLDAGTRSWTTWDPLPTRDEAEGRRTRLAALPSRGEPTEAQLALALCHHDGRVREAALRPAMRHTDLLPLVVVRTADWAAPVRERARALLREALDVSTAVALTPLILLVGHRDRGVFATELLAEVLRRAPLDRLAPLFTAPERAVRRFVYRLAIEERRLSPAALARAAARDGDGVVENLCADAALAASVRDSYDDVLEPLLTARNPRARSAGVTALRRAGRPERAVEYLSDRSALVRACARYVVRQYGTDPLPLYRSWCSAPDSPALRPGSVVGLAECGERADAELLWPLLAHPALGVRARAVAALRLLDVSDVRRLRPLLDDSHPGVVRETTVALLPSAGLLPEEWLMERLGAGRARHTRVAAFRLLDARGGVARRRAAVALLDDPDRKLRAWAGQTGGGRGLSRAHNGSRGEGLPG